MNELRTIVLEPSAAPVRRMLGPGALAVQRVLIALAIGCLAFGALGLRTILSMS